MDWLRRNPIFSWALGIILVVWGFVAQHTLIVDFFAGSPSALLRLRFSPGVSARACSTSGSPYALARDGIFWPSSG